MNTVLRSGKLAFALAMGLSACGVVTPESLDPDAGPRDNQKQGAIVGAAIGAIAGLATSSDDDKTKGALLGAVIGAGVGGAIGADLDRQAQDLRNRLNPRVQITNTGNALIVTMPQDILFEIDSVSLRPDLTADLAALAQNLDVYRSTELTIIGHTDNTGTNAYNQSLSLQRAAAVSNALISQGVSTSRIKAFGMGEENPRASNLTPEGRMQNRRVDIVISLIS